MARQVINIGTNANDGTGDPLRTAFDKINDNFLELYGADGDANTLQANLDINGFNIISARSNENIRIIPNGTGTVELEKSTNITGALTVSTTAGITGNATVGGTLGVTGLSTLASFKGATGATVTAILDEDTMTSDSATALATQQSIKAYVDAQVTASDLDFQGDTGGALAVDLDSQTFTIAGGTGIDTAGSGQTLTINIDSTVATLTGTQTLSGKTLTTPTINGATMTGSVTIDNLIFNDTDISTSSNANLVLNPGGSGTIELQANTNVTGTFGVSSSATITGTLNTADITTTGNQTISGSLTTGSLNIGDLNITAEGKITTDTNGDVDIVPSGTGAINLTGPTNITGVGTVTGELSIDNLNINGNTISSTSGGISITPLAGQTVAITTAQVSELQATLAEITTLRTDKIQSDTSDADIQIDTQGTGVVDFRTATQGTVGSAGGASALPATPSGYLEVKIAGTAHVIPFYAKS
jgi:hypothetical protein